MLTVFLLLSLFQQYYCYLVLLNKNISLNAFPTTHRAFNHGDPPEFFDWRTNGKVSPVKNQLSCGACWAFSAVACIESHLKIYLKEDVTLSEQFLIDCVEASTFSGCKTGNVLTAFAYIVSNFGGVLKDEDYYPYVNRQQACRWNNKTPAPVPVIGYKRVPADEDEMVNYLYSHGPLTAAINANSMRSYKGNIDEPTEKDCNPEDLDHSVLIVGYNVYVSDNGKRTPYWIIKNSWGEDWGDNGYYYLVRGRNACGIASDISFAFVN